MATSAMEPLLVSEARRKHFHVQMHVMGLDFHKFSDLSLNLLNPVMVKTFLNHNLHVSPLKIVLLIPSAS